MRNHYYRRSLANPDAWTKLSPTAAAQLRRMLRLTAIERLARALGTTATTLLNADRGAPMRAAVTARLSAALEQAAGTEVDKCGS